MEIPPWMEFMVVAPGGSVTIQAPNAWPGSQVVYVMNRKYYELLINGFGDGNLTAKTQPKEKKKRGYQPKRKFKFEKFE